MKSRLFELLDPRVSGQRNSVEYWRSRGAADIVFACEFEYTSAMWEF